MECILPACPNEIENFPDVAELEKEIKDLEDKVNELENTQPEIQTVQMIDYSEKWDTLNKNIRDLTNIMKGISLQTYVNPNDLKPGADLVN